MDAGGRVNRKIDWGCGEKDGWYNTGSSGQGRSRTNYAHEPVLEVL